MSIGSALSSQLIATAMTLRSRFSVINGYQLLEFLIRMASSLKELKRMESLCLDPYTFLDARNYWDKGKTLRLIREQIEEKEEN